MKSLKPGCSDALWRERLRSLPAAKVGHFSSVPFESKNREISPISCNCERDPGGFLCTSDCVAGRSGFELSLPFCINVRLPTFSSVTQHCASARPQKRIVGFVTRRSTVQHTLRT